ncbi:heterokaryon incompatibility protein-domain-containing protein [Xylariaceae sp. FL1272]|nr:heterokaryon incompatibility protein-domain-containing protein [Xylariaceae sp. FL1272]
MATIKCELCSSLKIWDVRVSFKHHISLSDLKQCAELVKCDLCVMMWTALNQENTTENIQKWLLPLPSDVEQDTAVMLVTYDVDGLRPMRRPTTESDERYKLWIDIGEQRDRVGIGGGTSMCATLAIFARPDTFAGQYILGRYFGPPSGDTALLSASPEHRLCIRWAQDWLSYCERNHERCRQSQSTPPTMPTRLIDLGESSSEAPPKLHVTNGGTGRYIALSYSWGEGVRHKVQLKTSTMESLKIAIPESSMTRTHQECLQVARMLGYRYVWIDAFGIIQDDKDDWAKESVKIADVYGNAHLTIVAGRSDNSLDGFIKNDGFSMSLPPIAIPYSTLGDATEDGAECYLALRRSSSFGPITKRAWCFQELKLSRRLLIYGKEQMFFECREQKNNENGTYIFHRWQGKRYFDLSVNFGLNSDITREEVLERWYAITYEYSLREVFDPTDNFATMAGIAARFQRALGCRFLAGLWESDMLAGLMWKSRRVYYTPGGKLPLARPVAVKGPQKGKHITRAPSWSWLSLLGPIMPPLMSLRRKMEHKSNHHCHPTSLDHLTWSMDDWKPSWVKFPFPKCRLSIRGCLRKVRCSEMTSFEYAQRRTILWIMPALKSPESQTVPLEADEDSITTAKHDRVGDSPESRVVAFGFFDMSDVAPKELFIMSIVGSEGLMLKKEPDGTYSRLGVFGAQDVSWCYNGQLKPVVLI